MKIFPWTKTKVIKINFNKSSDLIQNKQKIQINSFISMLK